MHSNSLVMGILIGGLSIGALYLALRSAPDANAGGFPSEIRFEELEAAVRSSSATQQALATELRELSGQLANLGSRVARQPLSVPADAAPPATDGRPGVDRTSTGTSTEEVSAEEFRSLMAGLVRMTQEGSVSVEDQERFWEAARTTTMVDDAIEHLEAQVAEYPGDQAARMDLADAYVAKLLTVPTGPERGVWGSKAEGQWQALLEQNPDHWEAQYVLAYDYSMYPDFVNRTDEAISGFESALRIQERLQPQPEHAMTYVQLARMYTKIGNVEKARQALELGQSRHPRHEGIADALKSLRDG